MINLFPFDFLGNFAQVPFQIVDPRHLRWYKVIVYFILGMNDGIFNDFEIDLAMLIPPIIENCYPFLLS